MIITFGINITDRELAIKTIKMARQKFNEVDYKAIVELMADNELIEESEAVRLEHEEPEELWQNV